MKKKVVFYTSINRNYLANARVLAKSVKDVFPDCTFVLLFNDVTPAGLRWHEEPFDDVVFAHELGIPDFLRFAFGYSVVEFCTATKPWNSLCSRSTRISAMTTPYCGKWLNRTNPRVPARIVTNE